MPGQATGRRQAHLVGGIADEQHGARTTPSLASCLAQVQARARHIVTSASTALPGTGVNGTTTSSLRVIVAEAVPVIGPSAQAQSNTYSP